MDVRLVGFGWLFGWKSGNRMGMGMERCVRYGAMDVKEEEKKKKRKEEKKGRLV